MDDMDKRYGEGKEKKYALALNKKIPIDKNE